MNDTTNSVYVDFSKMGGLVPVVVQDALTDVVLMVAWMNREAFDRTLQTGQAWYYSRSRKELWHKGATSGHIQHVEQIWIDCDCDSLLLLVRQIGVPCHTGQPRCFFTKVEWEAPSIPSAKGVVQRALAAYQAKQERKAWEKEREERSRHVKWLTGKREVVEAALRAFGIALTEVQWEGPDCLIEEFRLKGQAGGILTIEDTSKPKNLADSKREQCLTREGNYNLESLGFSILWFRGQI